MLYEKNIYSPEFIPVYLYEVQKYDLKPLQSIVYGFIRFYTKQWQHFFFKSAQLWKILWTTEWTINNTIAQLEKKWLIKRHTKNIGYKRIREIELLENPHNNWTTSTGVIQRENPETENLHNNWGLKNWGAENPHNNWTTSTGVIRTTSAGVIRTTLPGVIKKNKKKNNKNNTMEVVEENFSSLNINVKGQFLEGAGQGAAAKDKELPCNFYAKRNDPRKIANNYAACLAEMSPAEIDAAVHVYLFNNHKTDRRYLKYLENILSVTFLKWLMIDTTLLKEIWKQNMTKSKYIHALWKAFGFSEKFDRKVYTAKIKEISDIMWVDILDFVKQGVKQAEKQFYFVNEKTND